MDKIKNEENNNKVKNSCIKDNIVQEKKKK